jgi:hypothetical protein
MVLSSIEPGTAGIHTVTDKKAIAACFLANNTLHSLIIYWCQRRLSAVPRLADVAGHCVGFLPTHAR